MSDATHTHILQRGRGRERARARASKREKACPSCQRHQRARRELGERILGSIAARQCEDDKEDEEEGEEQDRCQLAPLCTRQRPSSRGCRASASENPHAVATSFITTFTCTTHTTHTPHISRRLSRRRQVQSREEKHNAHHTRYTNGRGYVFFVL